MMTSMVEALRRFTRFCKRRSVVTIRSWREIELFETTRAMTSSAVTPCPENVNFMPLGRFLGAYSQGVPSQTNRNPSGDRLETFRSSTNSCRVGPAISVGRASVAPSTLLVSKITRAMPPKIPSHLCLTGGAFSGEIVVSPQGAHDLWRFESRPEPAKACNK